MSAHMQKGAENERIADLEPVDVGLDGGQAEQVKGGVSFKVFIGRIWGAIGGGSGGDDSGGNAVTGVRG